MSSGLPPPPPSVIAPNLKDCAQRLLRGEVLCAPTDSFYGLIARATDPEAVARIVKAKGERQSGKAMPLLVADLHAVWDLATLAPWAVVLASLWPAPLTLALPRKINLPDAVAAADETLGIRIPDHPWLRALAREVGGPLTATSANVSGQPAQTQSERVRLLHWQNIVWLQSSPPTEATVVRASTVVTASSADGVRVVREGPVEIGTIEQRLACARIATSTDAVWNGQARFTQPERQAGYRFNLDSLLLVDFVRPAPSMRCYDLGAGVGIIGQLLLRCHKAKSLVSIERQVALAFLAAQNAETNDLTPAARTLCLDLREAALDKADFVVFNPPYFPMHAGRPNLCQGRDEARRECHGTLEDFVAAAAKVVRETGRLSAIVPYERRDALREACARFGFVPLRSQAVLAFSNKPPRHYLLEAQRGVVTCEERLAPWVIHQEDGTYRPDVERLTRGQGRPFAF